MGPALLSDIKTEAKALLGEIIQIRRHLHSNPELSFQEEKTAQFISELLTKWQIPHQSGVAGYGIVATIQGKSDQIVALRADMDALPILEKNEVDYISKFPGIMHACGHDVHMACLLGATHILNNIKEQLPTSIRIVFQPGEEKLPGGASLMIGEGVLQNPEPLAMIGQHVYPPLEAGQVGVRSGLYMASADEIYITVQGKGGHAAMPHEVNDVVLAASQMIVALQQIVSRNARPIIPSVLSFGKFNTIGGATNVMPDEVKIEGTFRTMDEAWRSQAHQLITSIVQNTCAAYGTTGTIEIRKGYPCLINDEALTQKIRSKMVDYLGKDNVIDLDMRMTSEDFAFYSQVVPSCFYRLGTGNTSKNIKSPVHTSTFDIDEDALETGMGLMAWLAVSTV